MYRHTLRMKYNRIPKKILNVKWKGKLSRGSSRTRREHQAKSDIKDKGLKRKYYARSDNGQCEQKVKELQGITS